MAFDQESLELLDRTAEVELETRAADGTAHRTIVWIVVDRGEVFVRSYRGSSGRWYREALADPGIAIRAGGRRLPAVAVPAHDPGSVARASAQLARKYAADPSTPAMLRVEILETTLRLDPA